MIYDLVIVGGGSAGMSAALYASRAMLKYAIIEKSIVGGQILSSENVDNYLGLPSKSGFELIEEFDKHITSYEPERINDEVVEFHLAENPKRIELSDKKNILAKTVILAMGATHRKLNVLGEEEFIGSGVSYCATCDGAFYRNKTVAVIGGGDTAFSDAVYLSRLCQKVYIIHRRNKFSANKALQQKVLDIDNIEIISDTVVQKIEGEQAVSEITINDVIDNSVRKIEVSGVFVAVGIVPESELLGELLQDSSGFIVADESGETSVKGVFVAGDIRTKQLRQVCTAVSDGANCVCSVEKFLESQED